MENNNKINLWPYAIAGSIFAVFGLCVWTVKETSENPVEMDSFYFENYQKVEENYGKILKDQKAFDKKFKTDVIPSKFFMGKDSRVDIKLVNKESNIGVNDANMTIVITRPDSSKFDKHLKLLSVKDGVYHFSPFVVNKPGRWQIMTKIKKDNLISFYKVEVNATK